MSGPAPRWWERGLVYQVYPRSFLDSNGDGVGDLPGITRRLDYLAWLGVDAVWVSPIYPSPMADFGYDVSDHNAVHPAFGTLADFDALVADAHGRGLKVVLDFVPNHTSDEHPWFVAARASRSAPRRDWYVWSDPVPGGGPPNNWRSVFGGSAWELDTRAGQYYYHAYLREQPDLNWRNPEVRRAMMEVLRFWLERGVDGFRVDAVHKLFEDERLRDNPPNPDWQPSQPPYLGLLNVHTSDLPEVHDAIAEMRRVLDEYGDRVLITEAYLPTDRLMRYYGTGGAGAHLPFNFQLIELPWRASAIAGAIAAYEAALPAGGWPNWVLGNHDRSRIATRAGAAQARVAAMLLLTLRGTPTVYYGDEIGMRDVPIPPELVQDPFEKNVPGIGVGRDPVRTPMQWGAGPNAGFSSGTPWLPVARDYRVVNVEAQRADPRSLLSLYRRLIELRRAEPALSVGSYAALEASGDVLAYARRAGQRAIVVALNLGPERAELAAIGRRGRILLSTSPDRPLEGVEGRVTLGGDEGVVIAVE
ncbi:MAG TPA: alpha-amylase family glycosyl hydrolase [Gemmatimonadaceae bacterium]|nr:alpha-amylase family glycosyl hydrolase [Gemmatimonadaceae bacterium]